MTEQHNESPRNNKVQRQDETQREDEAPPKVPNHSPTAEGEIIDLTCPEGDYSLWPAQGSQASAREKYLSHGEQTSPPHDADDSGDACDSGYFGEPEDTLDSGESSERDAQNATPSSDHNDDEEEHELPSSDSTSDAETDTEVDAEADTESQTSLPDDDADAESGLVPSSNADDAEQGTKPDAPAHDDERPMTLLDHLTELRNRLLRAFIAVAVGFLLCYSVAKTLFHYLALPLIHVLPGDSRLMFTGLPGGFFVELKVAFVAGIFLASPYLFYQIWAFIAPGLYASERKYVTPLAACSAFFFLGGASFCYFVVFPFAFSFFMGYATDIIVAMPSINEYLSFSLEMLMAFGLIFEMPLFAFFLARMGLITAAKMRKTRRYAILGVFIVAAILTPPDIFSQMLMAIPMLLLYELSILVAVMVGKEKAAAKAKVEAETEEKAL